MPARNWLVLHSYRQSSEDRGVYPLMNEPSFHSCNSHTEYTNTKSNSLEQVTISLKLHLPCPNLCKKYKQVIPLLSFRLRQRTVFGFYTRWMRWECMSDQSDLMESRFLFQLEEGFLDLILQSCLLLATSRHAVLV